MGTALGIAVGIALGIALGIAVGIALGIAVTQVFISLSDIKTPHTLNNCQK